jgi:hypothetical protein
MQASVGDLESYAQNVHYRYKFCKVSPVPTAHRHPSCEMYTEFCKVSHVRYTNIPLPSCFERRPPPGVRADKTTKVSARKALGGWNLRRFRRLQARSVGFSPTLSKTYLDLWERPGRERPVVEVRGHQMRRRGDTWRFESGQFYAGISDGADA